MLTFNITAVINMESLEAYDEYIKTNPLGKIVISKLLYKQTSRSNFKVDPFDKQEVKAILDATHHDQIKNLFQFAFFTGLRTSELIALEWGDIDLPHEVINVVRAVVKKKTNQGNQNQCWKS